MSSLFPSSSVCVCFSRFSSSRSSSLFQRKRDFEREREADSKDRLREQQEIEELRKQILAENKDIQDVDEEARRRHLEKVLLSTVIGRAGFLR